MSESPSLDLFSVRADYVGCEYGSLFIVAAPDASHAEDMVRAQIDWCDAKIESCHKIGTSDMFDDPQVVDQFAT